MTIERYRRLDDGLAIYLPNKQSKTYWVRFRVEKRDIKKSTGHRDIDKAVKQAYFLRFEMEHRIEVGLSVASSTTIKSISEPFLQWIRDNISPNTQKALIRYFNRYLLVDWGDRKVDEIKAIEIVDLYARHKMNGTQIGKYTKILLTKLFDWLELNELTTKEKRPLISTPKPKETVSFDMFQADELEVVLDKLKDNSSNACLEISEGKPTKQRLKKLQRIIMMSAYHELLAHTGARSGDELLSLTFRQFEFTGKSWPYGGTSGIKEVNITITGGKMGKRKGFRKIPIQKSSSVSIDYYCREIFNKNYIEMMTDEPDRLLFSFPDSPHKKVENIDTDFKDIIDELKKEKKINVNGNFAAYSFRHTYITFALAQKIDIYLLSEAVGNSVTVIQNTYSKMAASIRSDEIHSINIFDKEYFPEKNKKIDPKDEHIARIFKKD